MNILSLLNYVPHEPLRLSCLLRLRASLPHYLTHLHALSAFTPYVPSDIFYAYLKRETDSMFLCFSFQLFNHEVKNFLV